MPGPLQGLLDAVCGLPAGAGPAAAAALARPADPPALAETLTMLDDLVAHSMLQQRSGQDGQPRYFASEPVRDYAAGRRTPADALAQRQRRLDWLLRWAQALPATPPLPEVREEMPNLIAALEAASADGAVDDALRLVLMLQSSWGEIAIPSGALDLLGRLLDQSGLDPSLAGGAHALAAWSCFEGGRREDARHHATQALAQPIPDDTLRAMVLSRIARVRWRMDRDAGAARALLATGLPLARALGRANTEAAMLSLEAHLATTVDHDPARGAALNRQAQELWERSGNVHLVNAGRYNTAVNHQQAGRHAQALEEFDALADAGRAMQDWDLLAGALDASGSSWLALRRWEKSAQALQESLQVAWHAMEMKAVAFALWNIPPALARCGQAALAAQTMGFAERFWQLRFGDLDASDRRDLKRVRRFARCRLGAAETSTAWGVGRERSLAEAVQAVLNR